MASLGMVLLVVGLIINVVASIAILFKAFQESLLWGLGSLFVPFVALIFIVTHWDETKKPFTWSIVSLVPIVAGVVMMPGSKPDVATEAVAEVARPRPTSTATALNYDPDPVEMVEIVPTSDPAPATPQAAPPRQAVQEASLIQIGGKIEQVYVDNSAKLFYAETCKTRPANAYRMSKKLAMSQGFSEGTCPP